MNASYVRSYVRTYICPDASYAVLIMILLIYLIDADIAISLLAIATRYQAGKLTCNTRPTVMEYSTRVIKSLDLIPRE